ncbi:hypothetical protein AtubIFM56815_000662 [Aspergillus tubingensis]|uniref:Uncharacterized protein n=2 Tax=Aspergillus subgen. Circumdati TaxID=2720871 RepID=A0A8H3T056_ASPTU|nr:glycoside hydrolase family 131 protein [Aspergillus tubingensis]GAQ41727.1 similar to An08g04630 [Aspergillus niger]GFN18924.1 glycoside hydrolase family 131 protein [Aspergillus tubingensis]GLA66104.1 hypothetical protein AtubIFM54640_008308 [Aspergillus tubingensis]GLA79858.1 hypothetical protein AtubIFM56815_000662 [Aspergillus tubingensis]GLB00142.1 hypothetical protein AtubIFM57143_008844 [Aspergillus tubingensis]
MKGAAFLAFPASTLAGSVLWSGIFNSSYTVADFDEWSWSNQIAPWQWYIHGDGETSEYLALSSDYKNPAASDAQGLRTRLDNTSFWEGQSMQRTELIPQMSPSSSASDLGSGHLYYHFSLSASSTNPPSSSSEHQIAFFESHFTELQYQDNTLKWNAGGDTHYSVELETGKWYNFAYDIDFDNQKVGLWASNGSDALTEVVSPVSASASSNGADFHVGVLSLTGDGTEDWFWSGVYIEKGDLTKTIGDGSSASASSGESSSTTAAAATTSATSSATSAATTSVEATTAAAATPTQNVAVASSSTTSASTTSAATTSSSESTAAATPSASAPVIATPSAAPSAAAASESAALPVPTTASEILTDVRALLTALLTRQGVHARDFTV